jgi:hypothetical protein
MLQYHLQAFDMRLECIFIPIYNFSGEELKDSYDGEVVHLIRRPDEVLVNFPDHFDLESSCYSAILLETSHNIMMARSQTHAAQEAMPCLQNGWDPQSAQRFTAKEDRA